MRDTVGAYLARGTGRVMATLAVAAIAFGHEERGDDARWRIGFQHGIASIANSSISGIFDHAGLEAALAKLRRPACWGEPDAAFSIGGQRE